MDLLARIRTIIDSKDLDDEIVRFLSDIRESLTASSKQFVAYKAFVAASLVTYHLVVYSEGTFSFNSVEVSDRSLFQRVFLVVPAAFLCAQAAIGYLRRIQRETYDLLQIARCPRFGETGLHELRLPADYIVGLFVLRNEGGIVGRTIANVAAFLSFSVFLLGPAVYVAHEAMRNISIFGVNDALSLVISVTAVVLCISAVGIVALSGRVKVGP